MELLNQIPAVVRIAAVFVIILVAIRKKLSLGNAFLLGSVLLGLIFGLSPLSILRSCLHALIHPKTLALSAVVSLILVLSHSMESTGQMKRLLERFQGLVRHPGLALVTFPALIGLLPMPGGAIFSAPMVNTIGHPRGLSGAQLSFINYWFRHIWEYWWPLYPGILLAIALADLDLSLFVICLFPLSSVALLAGYWPLRKTMAGGDSSRPAAPSARSPLWPFVRELGPILLVIVLGLGAGTLLNTLLSRSGVTVGRELGLIAALAAAIGWVWHANGLTVGQRWGILGRPQMLRMIYMVAGILIFKGILEDSRAVAAIGDELIRWHIPLAATAVVLPFLVGMVAGITIAFVGTTFPILISLVTSFGQGDLLLAYMMLGLVSGFVGVLLSPLHLCLVLSNEYFDTRPEPVYRLLTLPCLFLLAGGILYFEVLSRILPLEIF